MFVLINRLPKIGIAFTHHHHSVANPVGGVVGHQHHRPLPLPALGVPYLDLDGRRVCQSCCLCDDALGGN